MKQEHIAALLVLSLPFISILGYFIFNRGSSPAAPTSPVAATSAHNRERWQLIRGADDIIQEIVVDREFHQS